MARLCVSSAAGLLGITFMAAAARAAGNVYVGNVNGSDVSQYSVGPGGALTPLSPALVPATHPAAIAISPDARSVYVANFQAESVSQYDVGAGGALSPKSPATAKAGVFPVALAVSPDGRSVYVADEGSNAVSQYDVGPGGALTPKSPATVPAGAHPEGVAVAPDGTSVYVTNPTDEDVSQYDVGAGGALTPKSPTTVSAGKAPLGIAVSPDGRSVYLADEGSNAVSQYDVGPGGHLAPKSPPTASTGTGTQPNWVYVSPNGLSLYAVNENSVVSQYDIAISGALAPKTPASFSVAGEGSLVISPDGGSAYITNSLTNMIDQYDVGGAGLLTAKSPATVTGGAFPGSIAVTPDQGPIASFGAKPAAAGLPTAFDGSASSDPDGSVARYDWNFGDGTSGANAGPRPAHAYGAAGRYTVTLQVTDDAGCSATLRFTGQTAYCNASPAAITSATITVPSAPVAAPRITAAHQSASAWREGSKLVRISRRKGPPVGTTFTFSLNEQAAVSLRFTQRVNGRKAGRRCLAQTHRSRHRRACKRTVTAGTLSFAGHAHTNQVAFQGRLSRAKKLKPGRYSVIITATNSVAARSAPVALNFTIVR
jgi:YVTN family beta-propeller protein